MSTNLYWVPAIQENGTPLPKALKYIVARRWWGHDGSLGGDKRVLTSAHVSYLEGMRDGTTDQDVINGVNELLKAIEKYGAIEVGLQA